MTNVARETKKDRQNAAREKARVMREAEQRKRRQRRWITQGSIGVVVIAILVVIAIVVVNAAKPTSNAGPRNMNTNGILLTSTTSYVKTPAVKDGSKPAAITYPSADQGKIHITLYEDLQCPYCRQFEIGGGGSDQTGNDAQLAKWLNAGTITLEIHPIAFLDSESLGNKYSTRADNAMAAVAQYEPTRFWAANKALYEHQPGEETNGKTDAQILAVLKSAGASSPQITKAVHEQTFKGWTQAATDLLDDNNNPGIVPGTGGQPFPGTPAVVVNGKIFSLPTGATGWGDPADFLAFVKAASGKDPNATS